MSKYKLNSLNLANLHAGEHWNLVADIQLPAGSSTTYYPPTPKNSDQMTIAELKAYALAEFERAND